MGNASPSDRVRSATKIYAKMRLNPRRFSEYLAPLLVGSASSGASVVRASGSRRRRGRPCWDGTAATNLIY
jgi:hypothetical protein